MAERYRFGRIYPGTGNLKEWIEYQAETCGDGTNPTGNYALNFFLKGAFTLLTIFREMDFVFAFFFFFFLSFTDSSS